MAQQVCLTCIILLLFESCKNDTTQKLNNKDTAVPLYSENFRPQYHFTPQSQWMNDPNGLVYNQGTYHLYYQYYPDSTVWGPMHWGHATSQDLKSWEHQPIALKPDSLGYIFSGSAVVDHKNSSGLGTADQPPLIAMFTYHDPKGAETNRNDYQYQGIAYSLDNGQTFKKYTGNPVVPNTQGFVDFRDPKVFWHQASQKWILVLVAGDRALFYNSENLIDWNYLSEFGKDMGAHGGVWECPDLFPLVVQETGETKWVLLISINPGAPNGGSGTQYFIGDFDGQAFTTDQKSEKWIDWGRDNYAGITYNNLPDENRIFIGWMSNWEYGQEVPTQKWRSAMTLPRKLNLHHNTGYFLSNLPIPAITQNLNGLKPHLNSKEGITSFKHPKLNHSKIAFKLPKPLKDFEIKLSNDQGEWLSISYDAQSGTYQLDRTHSGLKEFSDDFATPIMKAPAQFTEDDRVSFAIYLDSSSLEFFADKGANALTSLFFPRSRYTHFELKTPAPVVDLVLTPIPSIWKSKNP